MGRAGRDDDRGSVTTELALALPAVVLVLALVLTVSSAALAQQRSADAARTAARLAAAGEPADAVHAAVGRIAGVDAVLDLTATDDGWVDAVVVGAGPRVWFLDGLLPVRGHAAAMREPDTWSGP